MKLNIFNLIFKLWNELQYHIIPFNLANNEILNKILLRLMSNFTSSKLDVASYKHNNHTGELEHVTYLKLSYMTEDFGMKNLLCISASIIQTTHKTLICQNKVK